MSAVLFLLALAASAAVIVRCVCTASKISAKSWTGHRLQFAGLSAGYALTCGGAVGILFGWHHAPLLLLLGVAGWVIFERRQAC